MSNSFKAAIIQTQLEPDIDANLSIVSNHIKAAASDGAQLISTPENSCHMVAPLVRRLETSLPEEGHPALLNFQSLAQELNVMIHVGSLQIMMPHGKIANRSYVISGSGEVLSTYDKIHLFDVDLPDGQRFRESEIIEPGHDVISVDSPYGHLGLSICYDIRFPHLYRSLAQKGADILMVPAAFSMPTGQAHWESLLRARAIENGAFVIAAGQVGPTDGGPVDKGCWGHSMIVGPWGDVLAQLENQAGYAVAEINLDDVQNARAAIPSLKHDRDIKIKQTV